MNEYNIKLTEALNGKLPHEKIVPIEERTINIFDSLNSVYEIIYQKKYIFIDGEYRGETFIRQFKIKEICSHKLSEGPNDYCYNWRLIENDD